MKKRVWMMAAGAALCLAAPGTLRANGLCPGEVCVVRSSGPQWVMVFALDDCGALVQVSRGRSAEYVPATRGRHDACVAPGRPTVAGLQIVVASDRPFCLPRDFDLHAFHAGHAWNSGHTRRLCRLLEIRPASVRVSVHKVGRPIHAPCAYRTCTGPCGHRVWPWSEVEREDRVYIDGGFAGLGLSALLHVASGPHRVTVVTHLGRKTTRWVTFPSRGHEICERERACR